ncbi:nicotinate-nucleotide--dimethylbenzimidazole phosphoribosyltransferase [Caulobacter sp. UNC279MFTsu5.1]|uniref:nicotinate-nucleotide--dimethylbenzimidazole phosphoribosyltransferase n=1 Tax=Caulobacter sp. UNC279MFTsu5.1 TaxID=1502775 RepID=UPI0008EBD947|nr:nicotinate-nucleotide--dimethylbenzimidazole phosphoribosyltransferase [Caulobacter sp. UNC279MFTsu5.1]SFK55879.1 nicotinate-nucleotide-dimethylbenzimidazole phosphoribosyltransferase [Caulobacter sp. UNC279MFTsu5.1]
MMTLPALAAAITPVDAALEPILRALLDGKAKPPGSLGQIEDLAVRIGLIQNRPDPRIARTDLYVFAGDHGLTDEGVSAYPSSVTAAMVGLFLSGRSSVSAFAKASGVQVRVVDAGVDADLPDHPDLIAAKIRPGTRNAAREPALTPDEVLAAVAQGADIARAAAADGADVIALGEMGIGNSSSAALVMHRLAPAPLDACVGQGTGHDAEGLARKMAGTVRAAQRSDATQPLDVLAQFGGCEIAMMAGAVLGAASMRRVVLVDGFISTAAALAAVRLVPAALDYCVFAHGSAERGHPAMLQALGARPLLDLGLRLGEGTGAALAAPLLVAAANLLTEVAALADVLAGGQASPG